MAGIPLLKSNAQSDWHSNHHHCHEEKAGTHVKLTLIGCCSIKGRAIATLRFYIFVQQEDNKRTGQGLLERPVHKINFYHLKVGQKQKLHEIIAVVAMLCLIILQLVYTL